MARDCIPALQISDTKLMVCALGVTLVVAGSIGNNIVDQIRCPSDKVEKIVVCSSRTCGLLGLTVFAGAIAVGRRWPAQISLALSIFILVLAYYAMGISRREHRPLHWTFPASFAVAWLTIGYICTSHFNGVAARFIGPAAAICIVGADLFALPTQRRQCIVDGPGAYLFVMGLFILMLSNAVCVVAPLKQHELSL